MRILVVQESDWIKRGPHQQHHLMERLQLRGHKIRVIDFEIQWKENTSNSILSKRFICYVKGKTIKRSIITVIRPSILKIPLLDYASIPFTHGLEIIRQIKEFRPDIIIGLGILNTYIAMKLAKKFNIPFVYYLIDTLHRLIPIKKLRIFGKIFESQTLRSSKLVFTINKKLRDYAIELGADPKKIIVLGAGIDSKRFNPNISGESIRKRYGIKKNEIVLFFMGWLYEFSGLKEVAESLSKYKGNNIRLMVLGRGDLYTELAMMKKILGDSLILVDWQPYEKVPEYIAASDICLLPAYNNEIMRDIVPIKIYEYMACGKPVIATKLPGIIKEFGKGNGIIYVNSPNEVLSVAAKLSRSRTKLRELGLRAANYVKRYSWKNITDQIEKILENLVGN
ncbi:MAG: glycosyltransferase family 4 protein [Candidatus Odinarchaeota archaeon]|nr:glycosyltransferase family 4 protein [Candidatus Odinarchaeota archaeon]